MFVVYQLHQLMAIHKGICPSLNYDNDSLGYRLNQINDGVCHCIGYQHSASMMSDKHVQAKNHEITSPTYVKSANDPVYHMWIVH